MPHHQRAPTRLTDSLKLVGATFFALSLAGVAGCAHATPPGFQIHAEACCLEPVGSTAADACAQRTGCYYGQALICRGAQPPPEIEEEERKASESCQVRCQCICEEDRRMCSQVP